MTGLFALIHKVLIDVGPFFIMLGLLIFVHELGHYLVAIYYGVRVETFSLGFGKKLWSYKRGETTYKIAVIPVGGYVKMFGDDPTVAIPEGEKQFAFLHKRLWPRTAIVLAGPLMNLLFAGLLFAAVGMVGQQVPGTQLGDIAPNTAAYTAGFRSGDTIKKIDGKPVVKWSDVKNYLEAHANRQLSFSVQDELDKKIRLVTAIPKLEKNGFLFSLKRQIGKIDGLTTDSAATMIGIADPHSAAAQAGLRSLDIIESINDKPVLFWRELGLNLMKSAKAGGEWKLKVQAYAPQFDDSSPIKNTTATRVVYLKVPRVLPTSGHGLLRALGIERSDMFLASIKKSSPADKAGLRKGDEIVGIDHQLTNKWQDVLDRVKAYKAAQGSIHFKVLRDGKFIDLDITPELIDLPSDNGATEKRYAIGVMPAVMTVSGNSYILKYTNPIRASVYGAQEAYHWTKLIAISFLRLVQDKVSARNLGSVISIGRVASRSFQAGLAAFLNMMAVISIDLFLLNLLPVPVLDGGHLLFFTIEAVKGAPLSLRKMEIAQQVGLVLLLSLMIFALFNDISHLISSW